MRVRAVAAALAKMIAVVVAAGAVGAGLGLIGAVLQGDADDVAPSAPQRSSAAQRQDPPRVSVVEATLTPAGSPSGIQRRRARLTARTRVANRGSAPLNIRDLVLVVGGEQLPVDPVSRQALGELAEPIPVDGVATGRLRFETTGEITRRLQTRRRATIRVAGQPVSFSFEIGEPEQR